MNFSGALMEGICLSYDIVKTSNKTIFSINPIEKKLSLLKLDYKNLALFVRDFLRKILDNENLDIYINKIKFPTDSIYGMNIFNEDNNEIHVFVNSELNECWTRFVICKELIQLYLDCGVFSENKSSYTPEQIIEQIKEATISQHSLNSIDDNYEFSMGFEVEALAYIVVTDLFFPVDNKLLVQKLGVNLIDVDTIEFSHYDLAKLFKTPEFITRFYRSEIEKSSLEYLETFV